MRTPAPNDARPNANSVAATTAVTMENQSMYRFIARATVLPTSASLMTGILGRSLTTY